MPRISRTKATPPQKNTTYHTAIYARLSAEELGDSQSLENQVAMVEKYLSSQPQLKHCATFTDNGETGTNFNRSGFSAMMEAVKRGEINCIVVKDLSRFGRNYIETGEYLEKILPFMGVRFIAVTDGLDSANHSTNGSAMSLISSLKNLMNDVYAKDISQKVSSALRLKQQQGCYIGGHPPYGYLKCPQNRHQLLVDEAVAPIVRDIFKWKGEGLGDVAIARRLNAMGIPSPMKRWVDKGWAKSEGIGKVFLWRDRTIRLMTTNPLYLGHMAQGKFRQSLWDHTPRKTIAQDNWVVVENTHEAIVDAATFEKAGAMRLKNTGDFYKNYDKSRHVKNEEYPFKGKLVCDSCGSKFIRKKIWAGKNDISYHFICPLMRGKLGVSCNVPTVCEKDLADIVRNTLQLYLKTNIDASRISKNEAVGNNKDIASLEKSLKHLTAGNRQLFEKFADKQITQEEYIASKNQQSQKISDMQKKLAQLQQKNSQSSTKKRILTALDSTEFLQAIIATIVIQPGAAYAIQWNFSDNYKGMI